MRESDSLHLADQLSEPALYLMHSLQEATRGLIQRHTQAHPVGAPCWVVVEIDADLDGTSPTVVGVAAGPFVDRRAADAYSAKTKATSWVAGPFNANPMRLVP